MTPPVLCPLPRTHRRLGDVYTIWYEALGAYPEPELFRRMLNSLLQETRNVTWMLQAEKHAFLDFDSWYPHWQSRMAGVEALRWALEMRNQVVKKGDLETRSIARVSMLATWDNPPAVELPVPPMVGPASIAQLLKGTGVPKELFKDAVAVVERRWVVDSLPDREVLDALAECYGVLHELVVEAHHRLGVTMTADSVEANRPTWSEDSVGDRPAGMLMSQEVRTARLKLATREWLTFERELQVVPDEMREKARERYGGLQPPIQDIPTTAQDIFQQAESILETAKRILASDRSHGLFVWTFGPKGVDRHLLRPEDRADKYVLWNKIADDVRRRRDWGLISVAEVWAWYGDAKEPRPDLSQIDGVKDIPGHGEALQVAAAFWDGQTRMYDVIFTRDESGGIVFGELHVGYSPGAQAQFLMPVLKVWQAWRRRDSGNEGEPLTINSRPNVSPTT